jgi:hypothetical protein
MTMERRRAGSVLTALVLVFGVMLLISAVAGFVIVPEHRPGVAVDASCGGWGPCATGITALSPTAYDVLRIGTWAALIVGTVLVALGLIRFAQRARPA